MTLDKDQLRKTAELQKLMRDPAAVQALIAENERLQSAARTLDRLCYTDNGGELWKPPLGKKPDFNLMDQLKAELEKVKADRSACWAEFKVQGRRLDELKAENEALRKERDARHPFKPFHEPAIGFTGCVICGVYTDHGGLPCPKMRATADATMGKAGTI